MGQNRYDLSEAEQTNLREERAVEVLRHWLERLGGFSNTNDLHKIASEIIEISDELRLERPSFNPNAFYNQPIPASEGMPDPAEEVAKANAMLYTRNLEEIQIEFGKLMAMLKVLTGEHGPVRFAHEQGEAIQARLRDLRRLLSAE